MSTPNSYARGTRYLILFTTLLILIYFVLFLWLKTDLFTQIQQRSAIAMGVKMVQSCNAFSQKNVCIYERFAQIAQKNDFPVTFSVMDRLQKTSNLETCHFISHIVGQTEVRKDPKRWKEILSTVNPYLCGGGFIHGALEELLIVQHKRRIDGNLLHNICSYAHGHEREINCIHTMGHIILLETGGNLTESVRLCKQFVPGVEDRSFQCYRGLFMEYTTKLNAKLHNFRFAEKKIDNEEVSYLEKICSAQKRTAGRACWEQMARYYLSISNNDAGRAFLLCDHAREKEYIRTCRGYLGSLVITAPWVTKENMKTTLIKFCGLYKTHTTARLDNENICKLQLMDTLLSESLTYTPSLISFCKSSSSYFQDTCFIKIGYWLSMSASQKDEEKYCLYFPQVYREYCRFQRSST